MLHSLSPLVIPLCHFPPSSHPTLLTCGINGSFLSNSKHRLVHIWTSAHITASQEQQFHASSSFTLTLFLIQDHHINPTYWFCSSNRNTTYWFRSSYRNTTWTQHIDSVPKTGTQHEPNILTQFLIQEHNMKELMDCWLHYSAFASALQDNIPNLWLASPSSWLLQAALVLVVKLT